MKKILCLTDAFSLGGAERQLIGLCYFLRQAGYNAELACYYEENFYADLIEQLNIPLHTLKARGKIGKINAIKQIIKKNGYDVVIVYKDNVTVIASLLKLFGLSTKTIVSERNTTQEETKRDKIKFFLYRFSDYIVPNSYSQKKYIENYHANLAGKIKVISNFTDTVYFCPPNSGVNDINNNIKILVAGRIARQKNIIRFLNVLKELKKQEIHFHVKWFGNKSPIEEEYEKECLKKIEELGIKGCFEFHPASSQILEEYQKCDVFCLPSIFEGYPNVLCEAMSCGKPVLCGDICDNPFIVEDGKNGFLFNPHDEVDMLNKIKSFCLLSYEERMQMGKRSREIALEKFSEERFVQAYIGLIEK